MSGLSSSKRRRWRSRGGLSGPPRGRLPSAWFTVPAVEVLGFVSALLAGSNNPVPWFLALHKPVFMPPAWVFPVAWTVLYFMLGLALGWVLDTRSRGKAAAVTAFVVQMALNLAWAPVFFRFHAVGLALGIVVTMIAATVATLYFFARVLREAALMIAPYLAWLCFAAALNASILSLNPGL